MAKSDPLIKSEGKGGPRKTNTPTPFRRYLLYGVTFLGVTGLVFGTFTYIHYSNLIDQKLKDGPFPNTSMIFAAPRSLNVGEEVTREEIIRALRNAGYGESKSNRMGWYNQRAEVCTDPALKAILEHNRDEEKEHAAMVLEWIRRKDTRFSKQLKTYLFTDGAIAHG